MRHHSDDSPLQVRVSKSRVKCLIEQLSSSSSVNGKKDSGLLCGIQIRHLPSEEDAGASNAVDVVDWESKK